MSIGFVKMTVDTIQGGECGILDTLICSISKLLGEKELRIHF